jgi:chromosome segregation ATPase
LRQLIGKADNQLARISSRINQLETERQNLEREWEEARLEKEQLQALLDNLQQSIQENP